MRDHAELSASASERWMNCGGSIALSRGQPGGDSSYAQEGTAAHELAQRCLTLQAEPDLWLGQEIKGVEVTDEMAEAVEVYVEVVRQQALHPNAELMVEHKFSLAALDPPAPMFGTADAVVFDRVARVLYVDDLKYGVGVLVDPTENPQLLYYALGSLLQFESAYGTGLVDRIIMTIVQPRANHFAGPVRTYEVEVGEVVLFAVELLDRARAALAPDAPLTPGSWCRFCRARAVCPAVKEQSLALAQTEFSDVSPIAPDLLSTEDLAYVLNKADILEGWLKAVRERVQGLLEAGVDVPGWKVVPKRATRKWISDAAVREWAARNQLTTEQIEAEPKLRSPAQLEKTLKKTQLSLPEDLYASVSSGNTIAPSQDRRPALACSAADDFHALPKETTSHE